MLVSSLFFHGMHSSELVWDVHVCLFQQVEAQGVEWLENLQTRGVVTQRCGHPLQQLNLWNVVQLAYGFLIVISEGFVLRLSITDLQVLQKGSQSAWLSWNVLGYVDH